MDVPIEELDILFSNDQEEPSLITSYYFFQNVGSR
jgi:hypothetical protein